MPPKNEANNPKVKYQPIWSDRLLTNDLTGDLTFFGYSFTQNHPDTGVTNSRYHTNMKNGGQLPKGEGQRVYGIRVAFARPVDQAVGGVATLDVSAVMNSQAYLQLTRGDNDAFIAPLSDFSSGQGIVYSGTESDIVAVNNGISDPRAVYRMAPYFWDFEAGKPLIVTVRFETKLKLSASTFMRIYLDGPQINA